MKNATNQEMKNVKSLRMKEGLFIGFFLFFAHVVQSHANAANGAEIINFSFEGQKGIEMFEKLNLFPQTICFSTNKGQVRYFETKSVSCWKAELIGSAVSAKCFMSFVNGELIPPVAVEAPPCPRE